jgi:hypothetical protein
MFNKIFAIYTSAKETSMFLELMVFRLSIARTSCLNIFMRHIGSNYSLKVQTPVVNKRQKILNHFENSFATKFS